MLYKIASNQTCPVGVVKTENKRISSAFCKILSGFNELKSRQMEFPGNTWENEMSSFVHTLQA